MVGIKLDGIDIKILRILQRDGRTPFIDIAKQCGVSIDTVIRRFNRMRKMGVISGATILLNPKKLGYEHIASFGVNVSYSHVNDVVKFIQEIPEVIFCVPSMGKYNLFAMAIFRSITRIGEVRDIIKGHPYIKNVSTSIWVGQVLLCPENFEFDFEGDISYG